MRVVRSASISSTHPTTACYYKVTAVNSSGESAQSSEANATPAAAANSALFIKSDATTQGNWKGVYGADGYSVIGDTDSFPGYASVGITGQAEFTWASS